MPAFGRQLNCISDKLQTLILCTQGTSPEQLIQANAMSDEFTLGYLPNRQGSNSKCGGMRRHAIGLPALLWMGKDHAVTSFPRSIIPICRNGRRKMINIVATICHILKGKMNEFRFRLGLRPTPRCGKFAARSPDLLQLDLCGSTSKGREEGRNGRARE